MARIAMFLTRSPGPPMTGRKAVINTAIAALAEEHHDIDLFLLANRDSALEHRGNAFWLGTPPKGRALCNASLSMLGGKDSLNEALFRSKALLVRARKLGRAYDFAIADTIRAAPYASELGVPWHLDLDDLYSSRYEKYLERSDRLSADLVLGYYRASAPWLASALPNTLLKQLLKHEVTRLRWRELYWAGKATTVSLVSPDDARSFAHRASRLVHSLPMSVRIPARRWSPDKAHAGRAVFLGGLDYKPNLDALLYYQEDVFPTIKRLGRVAPILYHLGNAPADVRRKFAPEVVRFEGYVSDVAARLSDAAFFVAPIVSGTGIKTKVLEAMAVGLPVLTTTHGVAGLQVQHKTHCFICAKPDQFAEGIQHLDDLAFAQRMGLNARNYVEANFSIDVLRQRWSAVIRDLGACSGRII